MGHIDNQTVHAGHTIFIRVEDKIVGRAQGITGDRSFGTEGVYEIGSMMPQEHVHNRYEGSLNVERFFVRKNDLANMGLGAVGEEVLKKNIFTLEIVDKYTNEVVRSYHGMSIVTYNETFRVNSIAGENATFTYLYAKDGNMANGPQAVTEYSSATGNTQLVGGETEGSATIISGGVQVNPSPRDDQ